MCAILTVSEAARMAYELMLQEDFSHAPSRLLALYACVQQAPHFPTRIPEPTQPPPEEEEEEVSHIGHISWLPLVLFLFSLFDCLTSLITL